MDLQNKRDVIIKELETMSQKEILQKNFFKVRAYRKVIDQISKIEIVKTMDDLRNVTGIGEKIHKKIEEILLTGELQSAKRAREIPDIQLYDELMKIHGIGIVKAEELVKVYKIKSIDELIERVKENPQILNEKQRLGLQYHLDLALKIDRKEMDKHAKLLRKVAKEISKHIEIKMVGSYRRNTAESGDIDIIIKVNNNKKNNTNNGVGNNGKILFKKYIDTLKSHDYLIADLGSGSKKYMGICKLKNLPARRIDILYTTSQEFPFALLYFTGDFDINVELRKKAKELGYTLNEYKLTSLDGKHLYLSSEKEIFNFLGYKFLQPKLRSITNLKVYK